MTDAPQAHPRRLRLGMVGGGSGAFIGAVHRTAARLDDHFTLLAGALASSPERALASGAALGLDPARTYPDFEAMAAAEAARPDGIEVVAIVTPNHLHAPAARAFLARGIDVICDKPLAATLGEAESLVAAVAASGLVFGLTHNYSGYAMVREARALVGAGELGEIRVVQVEYAQDWLATPLERSGHKQALWRTDPARSGPGGAIGDIGTHAYHLARFVTGLTCTALAAELTSFVPGRRVDDNAQLMLRFAGGARGALWASQVALGHHCGLALRVMGAKGALAWHQETPETLTLTRLGAPPVTLRRAGPAVSPAHFGRVPAGHPEGYLEAFATLYADFAEQIRARRESRAPNPQSLLAPGIADGLEGARFIAAALASAADDGRWTPIAPGPTIGDQPAFATISPR